jgi:hypothetical protein
LGVTARWHLVYYENEQEQCFVQDFIDSRTRAEQAKIMALLSVLEEKGPNLPRPYADLLQGGIHELRVRGSGQQVRILYFFCYRSYIVLTHAFTKSSARVPTREITKAIQYREDFLNRYTEEKLKEILG